MSLETFSLYLISAFIFTVLFFALAGSLEDRSSGLPSVGGLLVYLILLFSLLVFVGLFVVGVFR